VNTSIENTLNLEGALRSAEAIEEYFREKENLQEFTVIMFADLSRSTEYKTKRRWFTGLLKIVTHNQVVSQKVVKYRGNVVKYMGDGVMCRFDGESSFISTNAINAAIAINEDFYERNRVVQDDLEQYHSRIGVSLGVVANLFGSDPYGPCVDLAARLQALAKPDQILASVKTIEAADITRIKSVFGSIMGWTSSDYIVETKEERIKGFDSRQKIATVVWSPPQIYAKAQQPGKLPVEPKFLPPPPSVRASAGFQERIDVLSTATKELIFRLRSVGGTCTLSRLEQKLAMPETAFLEAATELRTQGLGGLDPVLREIYLEPALSLWLDEMFEKSL
jgi:class 3 adenylate cyclase